MTAGVSGSADRVMVLSIHPRHVEKILDGTKSVELRRTRPLVAPGQPVAIYATLPSAALVATCQISEVRAGTPASIWQSVGGMTGLTRAEFDTYFAGAEFAVALHLDAVSALGSEITLGELRAHGRGFHPPQTWHFFDRQRLVQLVGKHPSSRALTSLLPATG
jgi:predicted transcriptional regulator